MRWIRKAARYTAKLHAEGLGEPKPAFSKYLISNEKMVGLFATVKSRQDKVTLTNNQWKYFEKYFNLSLNTRKRDSSVYSKSLQQQFKEKKFRFPMSWPS